MTMHLILPKRQPVLEGYRDFPMFFLAGPIRGGGDWQLLMSELLMKRFRDLIIVSPTRYEPPHPLLRYRMQGAEDHFERQTEWERHYLQQAAERWSTGCIIFWLGDQKTQRDDGEPYARDTLGEIGEWRGRMMYAPEQRIVMGAEPKFPGLSQIKRNFEFALPGFPIYETMEEVVDRAEYFAQPRLSFAARVSA